ncbi:hypothetical protein [Pseudolysinimonas sp.]|jgi:hypothetical protein|uniref:hypothetical protein n=1 Tax=Pseudolysinimonas sp. TaxID=2680009 RepID=UPI003783ACA5
MTTYEERHAAAREFDTRLATANAQWGKSPVFQENANLLGQLVSRLAIAGGGRDVTYLATEVTDSAVRVTVFVDGAVIDASFKEGALVVDVLPLDIRSLRVTSTQDFYPDERVDADLPLAVNVTLAEGRTLTLRGSGEDADPLSLFLPVLLSLTAA